MTSTMPSLSPNNNNNKQFMNLVNNNKHRMIQFIRVLFLITCSYMYGTRMFATLLMLWRTNRNKKSTNSTVAPPFPSPPLPSTLESVLYGHFGEVRDYAKTTNTRFSFAMHQIKRKWYKEAKSRTIQVSLPFGGGPMLLSSDPEVFKEILGGDRQDAFTNSGVFKLVFGEFFPTSIIVVEDEQWVRIRKVLVRAMTKQDMNPVVGIMCRGGDKLLQRVDLNSGDTYPHMNSVTFDSFHLALYGWDPQTLDNNLDTLKILDACNTIATTIGERALLPVPLLWRLPTAANLHTNAAVQYIKNFVQDFILQEKRESQNQHTVVGHSRTRNDSLLDALLSANSAQDGKLTDQELQDQMSTLFFGAYDTTSHSLMFLLNYAAKYPTEQEILRSAIKKKFPTLNALRQAKLEDVEAIDELKWFVDEVNRLHAIAQGFGRTALRDVEICGHFIPKGADVVIDHSTVAMDALQWKDSPNPPTEKDMEEFRPSRWKSYRPPPLQQPMPFGSGGRMCIGRKLALTEMKCFLARILWTHRLEQRVLGEEWKLDSTITIGFKPGHGNIKWVEV
jgi:cytochrome P450